MCNDTFSANKLDPAFVKYVATKKLLRVGKTRNETTTINNSSIQQGGYKIQQYNIKKTYTAQTSESPALCIVDLITTRKSTHSNARNRHIQERCYPFWGASWTDFSVSIQFTIVVYLFRPTADRRSLHASSTATRRRNIRPCLATDELTRHFVNRRAMVRMSFILSFGLLRDISKFCRDDLTLTTTLSH